MERVREQRPIPRRTGSRAEAAALRAQVRQARERKDFESERLLTAKLARLLVSRGTALAEATKLGRRSLLLGEEPKLRAELSSWFSSIGELSLAAGTLQLLLEESDAPAAAWLRVAVLRARDGDARAAMQALRAAFEADPRDPLALELLASLRGWAPESVTPARAAQALMEAAKRRHAKGDEVGFTEVLLQAIEAEPHAEAADRLARHLSAAGRYQAADEVWRASAGTGDSALRVHELRVREALGARDVPLALGATLDARADTRLDAESLLTAALIVESGAGQVPVPNFDGLLTPLGLGELLAARLLWLADEGDSPQRRAKALTAAARLFEDRDPRRSRALLCEAVEAADDPKEALDALLEVSDVEAANLWLAEAAMRLGRRGVDVALATKLLKLLDAGVGRVDAPVLWLWVLDRAAQAGPLEPAREVFRAELSARAAAAPDWLRQSNWQALSVAELRRAVEELRFKPNLAGQYVEALAEARRRDPSDPELACDLERVFSRLGRLDELEKLWFEASAQSPPLLGPGYGLIRLYTRHGATNKALAMLADAGERLSAAEVALLSALSSLKGDGEQRAAGLARLARHCTPEVSAVLLCQASEDAAARGQRARAFKHAENACQDNPRAARPILCCADVAEQTEPRVATLALERACEMVVPRSEYCRRLVELAEQQNEPDVALRWARRWVALAPLAHPANVVLLRQLTRSGDADELGKGLDWFIGQPRPRGALVQELGDALRRLAQIAPARALTLARRVLSAFGVAEDKLVEVLDELATSLQQPSLRVAVIERQLAFDPEVDAPRLLLEAAQLHAASNNGDACFDALARALSAGAPVEEVRRCREACPEPATTDGQLCRLRCQVEWCAHAQEQEATVMALRELGAAYWDLAADKLSALSVWERAAELDERDGDELFARDLLAFAGVGELSTLLSNVAESREATAGASLLVAGAAVLLGDGLDAEAIQLAMAALQRAPGTTEALAILERAVKENVGVLECAYQLADGAVLGNFGERALHYRAARQFERRRDHELALRHAVIAFEAVPAEGVAFALMLRLASLVGDDAQVTQALRRVAETAPSEAQRAHWLEIAARTAGPGAEGRRLRAEVLLRALAVRAEPEAVLRAGEAIAAVLETAPDEKSDWAQQFDTTLRGVLRSLMSADGAKTAVACAKTSASVFEHAGQVAAAVDRAVHLDPACSDFAEVPELEELLQSSSSAAMRVLKVVAAALAEDKSLAPGLLTLALGIAAKHAPQTVPELAVARALTEPPNPSWLIEARKLAAAHPELLEKLDTAIPREQRVAQLWAEGDRLEAVAAEDALVWFDDHLREQWLLDEERASVRRRMLSLHRKQGDSDAVEAWLAAAVADEQFGGDDRRKYAHQLMEQLAARGAHAAALDVVARLESWGELSPKEREQVVQIARQGGDAERELRYLEPQRNEASSPERRVKLWRRLWELHDQLGLTDAATQDAERLLELSPNDAEVHAFLVDAALRNKDHGRVARLLEERLTSHAGQAVDYGTLSEIYTDKLQDSARAADVLSRGLQQCGDEPSLLERLGRIQQRARRFDDAASLFERARLAVTDPAEVARFSELSCRCYLDAGDSESALRLLAERGAAHETEGMARLRVDVLRAAGTQEALAEALEQLATLASVAADQRAEWLCEAAEIASAQGDMELSLSRAQRAARTAPRSAAAQLLARRLEYLLRGAGTAAEALATITELRGLGELTDREQAAMRTFLLAEALDQRVGLGAGQRELENYHRRHGTHPLTAYGLAVRLSRSERGAEALALFDEVLVADLAGMADKKQVLLGAIECAVAVGDRERHAQWSAVAKDLGLTPSVLPGLPEQTVSVPPGALQPPRQRRNPDMARTWQSATSKEIPRVEEPPSPESAGSKQSVSGAWVSGPSVPPDKPKLKKLRSSAPAERSIRSRPEVSSEVRASLFPKDGAAVQPAAPVRVTSRPRMDTDPGIGKVAPKPQVRIGPSGAPPRPTPKLESAEERLSKPPEALFVSVLPETRPGLGVNSLPPPKPSSRPPTGAPEHSDLELRQRLDAGDLAAGSELYRRVEQDAARAHELVGVCRRIVELCPGSVDALERLHAAAQRDQDVVYSRALQHALAVMTDPAGAPAAPPLMHQSIQPDALLRLVGGHSNALEVLGLLWQSAPHLFRRQTPQFEGAQRVTNQTVSALGQVVVIAARLLCESRVDLFHREGPPPVQFELVAEQPARLLLWGPSAKDSPAFRFQLGSALLGTQRDYLLLSSFGETQVAEVLEAVLAAFGPPGRIRGSAPAVAHLAERLWEGVPSRTQRLLQELASSHPEHLNLQHARAALARGRRRAGLFLSGDLWVAASACCHELGLDVTRLQQSDGFERLCNESPEFADLVRLSTSVGFAEARWRLSRSESSTQMLRADID